MRPYPHARARTARTATEDHAIAGADETRIVVHRRVG